MKEGELKRRTQSGDFRRWLQSASEARLVAPGVAGGMGRGVWRFSANVAYGSLETPQLMNRDQPADVPVEQLAAL